MAMNLVQQWRQTLLSCLHLQCLEMATNWLLCTASRQTMHIFSESFGCTSFLVSMLIVSGVAEALRLVAVV